MFTKLFLSLAKIAFLIVFILSVSFGVYSLKLYIDQEQIELNISTNAQAQLDFDKYLDLKLHTLTIEEKRGLMFMVSIPDQTLSQTTVDFLKNNHIQFVILMSNNIVNEEQLKALTQALKEQVSKNIVIAIDQEGGPVTRIKWDQYANLSAREIGQLDTSSTQEVATYRAQFLTSLGIDMMLGPVGDIDQNGSFIADRSYSNHPDIVASNCNEIIRANQANQLLSSIKHFPGHGATRIDSHYQFPTIVKTISELESHELVPFQSAIKENVEFVMFGHIIVPDIDPDLACSISTKCKDFIEDELDFGGLIITDDLKMTGEIEGGINWGINLVIEDFESTKNRMQKVDPEDKYVKKMLELRYKKL